MKSKEIAKELYDEFFYIIPFMNDEGALEHLISKQCALITVNKISEHCYEVMKPFFQEVKTEIEKL